MKVDFSARWHQLSVFLETFDFVPILLIATVYHYFEALGRVGDPLIIAAAIAIVVDLSHYRSVRESIRSRRWQWFLAALFTTSLSFLLQYAFYNDGLTSIRLEPIVYAAVAPSLILLAAWRGEELRQQARRDTRHAHRRRDSRRRALATLRILREQLNAHGRALYASAQARTTAEERANDAEQRANVAESERDAAEHRANDAEAELNATREAANELRTRLALAEREALAFRMALDEVDQAIVLNHITGEHTQRDLAAMLNVAASTISDRKSRLNLNGASK